MAECFFPPISPPELFPTPLLRATPSAEPQEGGPVTLSCQTKLPLHRSTARLFFSFYKDGRTVRGRGLSSEFQIPRASEAHSGSYWCEAATEDNQVWKQSSKLEIRVQGKLVGICLAFVKSEGKEDWTHEPAFGVSRLRKDTEEAGAIIQSLPEMEESTDREPLPHTTVHTSPNQDLSQLHSCCLRGLALPT